MSDARRYILLPAQGFLSDEMRVFKHLDSRRGEHRKISSRAIQAMTSVPGVEDIEVVGSVADNGPKVVTMPTETARTLRKSSERFIVAPIRKYRPALRPLTRVKTKNLYSHAAARKSIQIFVRSAETGAPLSGAKVVAVLDPISMAGLTRISGKTGLVTLTFPGALTRVARLYVYPPHGFWGRYAENMNLSNQDTIQLAQIDRKHIDVLGNLYVKRARNLGRGVRVGVVDSGIDSQHRDLRVTGGSNLSGDGDITEHGPVTDHGTHVAGIIAGRGQAGVGMRGLVVHFTINGEVRPGASCWLCVVI